MTLGNMELITGIANGSELDLKTSEKKKKKRKREADDVGQDALGKMELISGTANGSELDLKTNKKEKKKRKREADDAGQDALGKMELITGTANGSELDSAKKKKKRKREADDAGQDALGKMELITGTANGSELNVHTSKKEKKKRKREGDEAGKDALGNMELISGTANGSELDLKTSKKTKKKRKREADDAGQDALDKMELITGPANGSELNVNTSKKKKKKRKPEADDAGQGAVDYAEGMEKKKTKKTVRFQEPITDDSDEKIVLYIPRENDSEDGIALLQDRNWKKDLVRPDLRYGKFTQEEDQKIKESVLNYIKMRGWDENEGLETVLNTSQYADARGCWLEIAKCLPIRPVKQIYTRAFRLLGGYTQGIWTDEEAETLKTLHAIHGNDWKKIAAHMSRSAQLCKDKWRRLRLAPTAKRGSWAQDECDKLCKLVRRSLRVKASLPAKSLDRREIRDDINWEWIAEEMHRESATCAEMWYQRLASPMIPAKKWANGDDHLLLQRLMELGAASEEAVDWDVILDHRDGECCTRRWAEMTRLLGNSDHIPFEDKVELLAKRYAPDLLGIEES